MALILTYAQRNSMTGPGLLNHVLEAERAPDGAVVCVVDQVERAAADSDDAPAYMRTYRGVMVKGPHLGRRVVIKGARTGEHLAHLQREAATYASLQHLQGNCIPHCVGLYTSPPSDDKGPQGCLVLVDADAEGDDESASGPPSPGLVFFGTAHKSDDEDSDEGYLEPKKTPTKKTMPLTDTQAMRAAIEAAEDIDYIPKVKVERAKPRMPAGFLDIPMEAWPKCLCAECRGVANVTPGPVWNGSDWERPAANAHHISASHDAAGEGWLVTELTP